MNYHDLTPEQQAQVAYLFADDLFGKDPSAYLYELDKGGNVTGRASIARAEKVRSNTKAGTPNVITRRGTIKSTLRRTAAIQALAQLFAENINQKVNA